MEEIGLKLREARETQDLSLAEVEAKARIRQRFLAAMEAEEWDSLPGDVTTRGFLRKYAAFLGLDPDQAVASYQASIAGTRRPPEEMVESSPMSEEREVDYRPIELDLPEATRAVRVPWRSILAIAMLLAILGGIWWAWTHQPAWPQALTALLPAETLRLSGDDLRATIAAQPTLTPIRIRVTATPTPSPVATASTTPDPEISESPGNREVLPSPTPQLIDRIRLRLEITERSWIRVNVDGQTEVETILEPGEQGDWEALDAITLRTGNAAGVLVTVNDRRLGTLGGPGEVVELLWQLQDGQIVESTPLPEPVPSSTPEPNPAGEDQTVAETSAG
jgi:cytoskeletal protein RodZ